MDKECHPQGLLVSLTSCLIYLQILWALCAQFMHNLTTPRLFSVPFVAQANWYSRWNHWPCHHFSLCTHFRHGVLMGKVYFPAPWLWAPLCALQERKHELEMHLSVGFLSGLCCHIKKSFLRLIDTLLPEVQNSIMEQTWGRCPSQSDPAAWTGPSPAWVSKPLDDPRVLKNQSYCFKPLHFWIVYYTAIAYWLKAIIIALSLSISPSLSCSAVETLVSLLFLQRARL